MSEAESQIITRLIAKVRAIRPVDWVGHAGGRFRRAVRAISDFAKKRELEPGDLLDQAVVLAQKKLAGLASAEHAAALRNYAEEEDVRINTKTKKLTLPAKLRQETASAEKLESEARLARIKEVEALIDLAKKLDEAGVELTVDENGNIFVQQAIHGSLQEFIKRLGHGK